MIGVRLDTLAAWTRSAILRRLSAYQIRWLMARARQGDQSAQIVMGKILSCCDHCGEESDKPPCGGRGSGCTIGGCNGQS
jgi:hypothetical protein